MGKSNLNKKDKVYGSDKVTKFDDFYEFVMCGFLFPLIITFAAIVIHVIVSFFSGHFAIWMTVVCLALLAITAIWGLVFLITAVIGRIRG